jgi:V8-like Glu-specific endopeptidase
MERDLLQWGKLEAAAEGNAVLAGARSANGRAANQFESFLGEQTSLESLAPYETGETRSDFLTASVGQNGVNRPADVKLVQRLINAHLPIPLAPLVEDGKCGPKTIFAIKTYQQRVLGMNPPDGRADVGGPTIQALRGAVIPPPSPPAPGPSPVPPPAPQPWTPSGDGPSNMRPAAWQYLLQFTKKHEGAVFNMYNNRPASSTKQDVTCGIGFLLDPREVATQSWVKTMFFDPATNQTPSDDQMLADWDAAANLARSGNNLGQYAVVCHMRMHPNKVYDRMAVILRDQKLPALLKSFPNDFKDFANYPAAAQVFCVSFAYGRLPFDFPKMRASIRDGRWAEASTQCRLNGASELKNRAHTELLLTAQRVVDQQLDIDTLPPLASPQHEFEGAGDLRGFEASEGALGEAFKPAFRQTSRQFDPYSSIRDALPPEQQHLDANEITVVLGRSPARLVLYQFLNSPQMRQAALAGLLGKGGRRFVRVNGADVAIPQYLRAVSRLCREVAEQSEMEERNIGEDVAQRGRGAGYAPDNESYESVRTSPRQPGRPERLEQSEQNEYQVAFDPFSPPQNIVTALNGKDWARALSLAIQLGIRDENDLTNLIFFAKHQDLPHTKLDSKNPKYKELSAEWLQILNNEVWAAIQAASENTSLVVSGSEVADLDRFYWGSEGKRLKQLVENAAKDAGLNPGLLGAIIMAETRRPQSYLTSGKVSSYHVGTDDFYEARAAIAARVKAYAKVHWDKTQTPQAHLNDATTPREVKTIFFDSGPDALLATAVYMKFREVRLREIAKDMKGDFDKLPAETRFALTRMAMAAGTAGVTPFLKDALAGKDIFVRKAIPVKIYQTQRNATVRTAQAMHLSEWIFGIAIPQAPPPAQSRSSSSHETNSHEANETREFENAAFPDISPTRFREMETESELEAEAESGKFGLGTRKQVANTQEVPFRWICAIDATRIITTPSDTHRTGLAKAGTGLLISPCHVLTAAHVLKSVDKDERGSITAEQEAEMVQVTPGLDDGNKPAYGSFRVKSWVLHPDWNPKKEDPKTDYALLTLEKCAGDERFASLKGQPLGFWKVEVPPSAVRASLLGGEVMTAGYPESKNKEMWCFTGKVTAGAQVDAMLIRNKQTEEWARKAATFHLTADAERGQSGSPVWVVRDGVRTVVGVLVDAGPQTNEAVTINEAVVRQLGTWMGQSSAAHEAQELETYSEGSFEATTEHGHMVQVEGPRYPAEGETFEGFEEYEDEAPRGLVLLDHMHIAKTLDATAPGGVKVGTAATVMTPAAMNPGFIDAHDEVVINRSALSLQTCLDGAITGNFAKFLVRKDSTKADAHDRVRIALVDLTGAKLFRPEFAGWGSTVAMYGASSAKILAVYAAFQLRKDLRQMAEDQAIPTGKELAAFAVKSWKDKKMFRDFPNLTLLFDIEHWSAQPNELNFTPAMRTAFSDISHNDAASLVINGVGFPYIASVAWQSGLRHPMRGGLWLSRAYDGKDSWADNPSMKAPAFIHNITALSVATFFTLLAQGRLVDDASSTEITSVLLHGCVSCLFPSGITLEATKCGIFKPYMHDCVLAHHSGARYAAGILTEIEATWSSDRCPTGGETAVYTDLCRSMDKLLVANQSLHKTACGG